MKNEGLFGLAHILLLTSPDWAIRLPVIFNPWLLVVPIETESAMKTPRAAVTAGSKFMVVATNTTALVGTNDAVLTVIVPLVNSTTLY